MTVPGWDRLRGWLAARGRWSLPVVAALLCGALAVDWSEAPSVKLAVGDVAPRTVTAPFDFRYQDLVERELRQEVADALVQPVFVYDAGLVERLQAHIDEAFETGRSLLPAPSQPDDGSAVPDGTTPDVLAGAFQGSLGVHLPLDVMKPLVEADFPEAAARLSRELLAAGMAGYVVGDRAALASAVDGFRVIERHDGGTLERAGTRLEEVLTPFEARQRVTLGLLDAHVSRPWAEAAATIARALVQENFSFDPDETTRRRDYARAGVPVPTVTVKRGTTLFRQGDPITQVHVREMAEMRKTRVGAHRAVRFLTAAGFLLALFAGLFTFGMTSGRGFSTRGRDVAAGAALLVVVATLSRLAVGLAPSAAQMLGAGAQPQHLAWIVPVAGAVMLVRLLVGVEWALGFGAAASVTAALVLGGDIGDVGYFMVSSAVAASAVDHTRERMAVLRAGLLTGLVNSVMAALLYAWGRAAVDSPGALTGLGPVFAMTAGLASGLLSAFLVLGLMPIFESLGFVTDYRMMELASLNHPLMRQLMLRAPGSYHHSVVVGSLAEAGCEAVGANALLARVASYFHDIGKSLTPQYFVENQGSGGNRHDRLDPYTSADVIIAHVVEGARLADEHNLPQPIRDNIRMHHGTGLLPYFFRRACDDAEDGAVVDETRFRYPGPKPNTREAGVIMLADKIEAATRTIRQPNESNIRAMIRKIVESVMVDGQFEECPLTFAEIHIITDSFVKTLLGIYHHRIEYPETAAISQSTDQGVATTPAVGAVASVIPIRPVGRRVATRGGGAQPPTGSADYESVEHLPGSKPRGGKS